MQGTANWINRSTDAIWNLLGSRCDDLREIQGGRNSLVYKADCSLGGTVVVKWYFERQRLEAEFTALSFLWSKGIRCIPEPLAISEHGKCALYSYVDGDVVCPQTVQTVDIGQVINFLKVLRDLDRYSDGEEFPSMASEACLNLESVFLTIEKRWAKLRNIDRKDASHKALFFFLEKYLRPTLDQARNWCRRRSSDAHNLWLENLSGEQLTLSPSDLGFHNILRKKNGQLVFLDFEHFGRDDPAKMIADFLLHPHELMMFDEKFKRYFLSKILKEFDSGSEWLRERLWGIFPLIGLKWSTILLNEFLPCSSMRRSFAITGDISTPHNVLMGQLEKAQRMLEYSRQSFDKFPYPI